MILTFFPSSSPSSFSSSVGSVVPPFSSSLDSSLSSSTFRIAIRESKLPFAFLNCANVSLFSWTFAVKSLRVRPWVFKATRNCGSPRFSPCRISDRLMAVPFLPPTDFVPPPSCRVRGLGVVGVVVLTVVVVVVSGGVVVVGVVVVVLVVVVVEVVEGLGVVVVVVVVVGGAGVVVVVVVVWGVGIVDGGDEVVSGGCVVACLSSGLSPVGVVSVLVMSVLLLVSVVNGNTEFIVVSSDGLLMVEASSVASEGEVDVSVGVVGGDAVLLGTSPAVASKTAGEGGECGPSFSFCCSGSS